VSEASPEYKRVVLEGARVSETADRLVRRIEERFPGSGLAGVASTVHAICLTTEDQIGQLRRPVLQLRFAVSTVALMSLGLLLYLFLGGVKWGVFFRQRSYNEFIGSLEPTLAAIVFLTAYFIFISNVEKRWKLRRILAVLSDLRGVAHVVDMHQLHKDPERFLFRGPDTASSPKRTLSPFELARYLDYCTEILAILGKLSALWAQSFPEPAIVTAVDQIETLTTALARKVWQKLIILESVSIGLRQLEKETTTVAGELPPPTFDDRNELLEVVTASIARQRKPAEMHRSEMPCRDEVAPPAAPDDEDAAVNNPGSAENEEKPEAAEAMAGSADKSLDNSAEDEQRSESRDDERRANPVPDAPEMP
jgi:hypothetical protein